MKTIYRTHATWTKESGYDPRRILSDINPMRNEKKTKTHRDADITALLEKARQKYGSDFVLINEGREVDPNWMIKHQPPKGNGGIRERGLLYIRLHRLRGRCGICPKEK